MTRNLTTALLLLTSAAAQPSDSRIVFERGESTIAFEPYAANVVRVTLSVLKDRALAGPGYGVAAQPSAQGWTHQRTPGGEVYASNLMSVLLVNDPPGPPPPATVFDIGKFFSGSAPWAHLMFRDAKGHKLVEMQGWQMSVPNYKDGNSQVLHDRRPNDPPFYQVGATFDSPEDEHYYGLGQNQEGFLDHRGHRVQSWHDYNATAGASVGVPFLITNYGYGLLWDNPSKTVIEPGFNEKTRWLSEVGDRVSFFVISGKTTDEIYSGYRLLTGATPLLPKAAYGYIQCKQRYASQDEVLSVAKGYRDRKYPLDIMVVDWFYYTKMGQYDMDPAKWPDPAAMNKQLHDMGIQTMISVWPRFVKESRFYDFILKKGWFEHLADGTPTDGLPYDRAGSDIDTTNPEAARWFWELIRDNLVSRGFDSFWADETEPDLPPNGSYFHIGPGTKYFNVYPLFHTAAIYDGFRRDLKQRAATLSRDAYIGAQRNGAMFWSSDIKPTWDTLRRQIPTGLGFTASGFAYWSNDTGGWDYLPNTHKPKHPPLLDPSDARENVMGYDDYPELYTRWFQYAAFQPIFRTHGSRRFNEVWTYGKAAEPILVKYLKLRYQLMPYIYSLGFRAYATGAPYMRALFMDFPNDPKVARLTDEYMFGPAFLVAPIIEQGATSRSVYLPAGAGWYNYWTNERFKGGQTIEVKAPIDTIPLFVRAGSILPLGEPVQSTAEVQNIAAIRVYPGADADFALYSDDGKTYDYEKGIRKITRLHWDNHAGKLTHEGDAAWTAPDSQIVRIIGR
jgi:alpha-D-xyloside xylohydrolase